MTAGEQSTKQVPIRVHPRAIAALGADLVTNDVVAIIELVKNSYDALASRVLVRFGEDEQGRFLEVEDDGTGMPLDVIEDVWAVVATPFRADHEWAVSGDRRRRASGAKGLGRLAAARLGAVLEMFTATAHDSCWRVQVDWSVLAGVSDLEQCTIAIERSVRPFSSDTGTLVRIRQLSSTWDADELQDLRENLSRLVPPFQPPDDFSILLDEGSGAEPTRVEPPAFLSHPKYHMEGTFDGAGRMTAEYTFEGTDGHTRSTSRELTWNQVLSQAQAGEWLPGTIDELPACGPFRFELRVWDIGSQDTSEISDRWDIGKETIRKAIRAHKGLSVYRDGILVIPKSEGARDWLGLDLRRISKTGVRISTSQVVGNVQISAVGNPMLVDTSDRERLVNTMALTQLRAMLFAAVAVLETERSADRRSLAPVPSEPTASFFRSLSADALIRDVSEAVADGAASAETLALVEEFSSELDKTREELERRFVYYSRLATIGTIAQMLIHEIRNRTTVLRRFVTRAGEYLTSAPRNVQDLHDASGRAIASLDSLADTFAPLANRRFRRGQRTSDLRQQVDLCLALFEQEAVKASIVFDNEVDPSIVVAVDPGELDAVLVNLISNAVYWLDSSPREARRLRITSAQGPSDGRVSVTVSDSGPGVREDALTAVMEPGFTLKPDGIGMGLTVAAEVVAEHGGELGIASPGDIGGATLRFDVPMAKARQ